MPPFSGKWPQCPLLSHSCVYLSDVAQTSAIGWFHHDIILVAAMLGFGVAISRM